MPLSRVFVWVLKRGLLTPSRTDGYYTGKDMFEQFTHKRTSIDNPSWYVALCVHRVSEATDLHPSHV